MQVKEFGINLNFGKFGVEPMGLIDSLKSLTDSLEVMYEKDLVNLRSFEGIERLDELIDLLLSLEKNETFKRVYSLSIISEEDAFDYDIKKIPMHYGANVGLGFTGNLPLYVPSVTHKIVDTTSMIAAMSLIQFSFIKDSGHPLTTEEDKTIILSDILYMVSFYVEDYDALDNEVEDYDFEFYKDFFKRMHNLYWENDKANQLYKAIREFNGDIVMKCNLSLKFSRTLYFAVTYLMGCNALKEGRDSINCDDVVIAYITGYKIILNDIRPLVYQLYDEEKWKNDESWKKERIF